MFELKTPPSAAYPGLVLASTRGAPVPDGLVADMEAIGELPDAVKAVFDQVLGCYLGGEPDDEGQAFLQRLCEDNDLDPQRLIGPIRGGRFLVTSAASAALTPDDFTRDITRLVEDPRASRELIGILGPIFEKAAPALRTEIVERSIAEHGKLVEACHWRIDNVVNSEHGDGINLAVAVLTFDYREGARRERITLQLLPEQLHELKVACKRMLPDRPRSDGEAS